MARIATWAEIMKSTTDRCMKDKMDAAARQANAVPPAPLLQKIRRTLFNAMPIQVEVLYCSPNTHAALKKELDSRNMPFMLGFRGDDFRDDEIHVDGVTVSVLPGTPDGEFIFFPG